MITRKQLADTIDEYDQQIADLQKGKRETYQSYREELTATAGKDAAKAEIEAFKVALKRRQAVAKKGEEVVENKDALADEIFVEITAARAPRATRTRTREIIEEFPARETLASTTAADPAGEADDASSADTLQEGSEPIGAHNADRAGSTPAPATTSTAARKDVQTSDGGIPGPSQSVQSDKGSAPAGTQAPPVDTHSEPEGASIGAKPSMATEPATEEGSGPQPSSVVPDRQPGCLNPDTCAGTWRKRCASCERAFMAVAAGGQAIVHQGQVA